MYNYMYICTFMRVYVREIYVPMRLRTRICMHACMYVCMFYTHICTHESMICILFCLVNVCKYFNILCYIDILFSCLPNKTTLNELKP